MLSILKDGTKLCYPYSQHSSLLTPRNKPTPNISSGTGKWPLSGSKNSVDPLEAKPKTDSIYYLAPCASPAVTGSRQLILQVSSINVNTHPVLNRPWYVRVFSQCRCPSKWHISLWERAGGIISIHSYCSVEGPSFYRPSHFFSHGLKTASSLDSGKGLWLLRGASAFCLPVTHTIFSAGQAKYYPWQLPIYFASRDALLYQSSP